MPCTVIPVICAAFLIVASPVFAETTQYLCIADYSTGFKFQNGQWKPYQFRAGDAYIVRRLHQGELASVNRTIDNPTWGVFEHGGNTMWAECEEPGIATMGVLGGNLVCAGLAEVGFNRDTLRFQIFISGNYVTPAKLESQSDTPVISIGRCSAL